jgi:hypothetical protein
MKRDILNYLNEKIGEMELPDNTPEEIWEKLLSPYKVVPPNEQEILDSKLQFTIEERISWAKQMLQRFKKRNISLGINGMQALWLHHRMRALEITFNGVQMVEDIINMSASGDIETSCLAIIYSTPDDGSQPYHWYTQSTKDWLISEMKQYLGWP